ncbi:MAG: hypothetical protein ACTSUS_04880 [Candidatus Freyarchaeota archaeon]
MIPRFRAKQQIFEVGGVKIGGQPGELPTLLVGNLFYQGMPEVTNHKDGSFDKKLVLRWIETAEKISEETGIPHFVDIMAMYPRAMRHYIEFVSEHSSNAFFIDGTNPETRVAGLRVVKELGLQEKVVFNAILPQTSKDELEALRESGVTAAVLLAYNEMDFSPEGRVAALKGFNGYIGLLKVAEGAGIQKALVDTVVFDVPSIAYAAKAVQLVKDELGYPTGCSPANATYDWRRARKGLLGKGFAACNASAHAIVQLSGADFLVYGPIKQARNVILTCAMNDAVMAYYAMRQLGVRPLVSNHPIYKIF